MNYSFCALLSFLLKNTTSHFIYNDEIDLKDLVSCVCIPFIDRQYYEQMKQNKFVVLKILS